MCGIAGILRAPGTQVEEREIGNMLDLLGHRGPDGSGVYMDRHLGLGHVRLAILDLSDQAAQPMRSNDERYVLTFNGEIFNFRELRHRLEERGIRVRSSGDTEVLLELLAAFGVGEILPLLEGFFAFALWDHLDGSLVLARDRHGIKPLYYKLAPDGSVHFASEMKPLIGPDTPPDPYMVSASLLGSGCVAGEPTLFRGIRHIEPGRWLRFDSRGQRSSGCFFGTSDFVDASLYRELAQSSKEEVVRKLADAFEESIDYRLISDAPVACLVSGGIDSSLIAAVAGRRASANLALYHADVEHNSERPWAEMLARELGLELFSVDVTDEAFLDGIAVTTHHAEIPIIYHANSVPFYLVSKLAAENGIKVVLTGEGSDEYFLGYPRSVIDRYVRPLKRASEGGRALVHRMFPRAGPLLWPHEAHAGIQSLHRLLGRFDSEELRDEIPPRLAHVTSQRDRESQFETLNFVHGHLLTLLHRNDRLGMASGIESRFPFLGHSLARLAVNLPARYKIRATSRFFNVRHPFHMDKWAVRALAERHLPRAIVDRPKKGFPITIAERLVIDSRLFHDGCVQDWFGLGQRAIGKLPERVPPGFLFSLLLVEVWGRLFWHNTAVEEVSDFVRRNVRIQPA